MDIEITDTPSRPMQKVLEAAKSWGFKPNNDMSTYHNLERIKEWLYDEFSIWTWVTCNSDFEFTPFFIDLRTSEGEKQKGKKTRYHQEALTTALEGGINKLIN